MINLPIINCATELVVDMVRTVPKIQSDAEAAAHTLRPILFETLGPKNKVPTVFPSITYAAHHVTNLDCHCRSDVPVGSQESSYVGLPSHHVSRNDLKI